MNNFVHCSLHAFNVAQLRRSCYAEFPTLRHNNSSLWIITFTN